MLKNAGHLVECLRQVATAKQDFGENIVRCRAALVLQRPGCMHRSFFQLALMKAYVGKNDEDCRVISTDTTLFSHSFARTLKQVFAQFFELRVELVFCNFDANQLQIRLSIHSGTEKLAQGGVVFFCRLY